MSPKPPPAYARAQTSSATVLPAARPLVLGDAPGTTEPGFPADHPAVSTVGEVLERFGLVPFSAFQDRPRAEQVQIALGNLDALTAVALTRGRRWQKKDGSPVVSPEPDVKGALAAQRAAAELTRLTDSSDEPTDERGRPVRDLGVLLAEARLALNSAGGCH